MLISYKKHKLILRSSLDLLQIVNKEFHKAKKALIKKIPFTIKSNGTV